MDEDINLAVGASFKDVKALKHIVERHAIARNFELERIKCESSRYTVGCKADGCPWRLHASKGSNGLITIKTFYAEHSCVGPESRKNSVASSTWLAREVIENFRDQPNYRPKDLMKDLAREKGLTVSYKVAWTAKEKAMTVIHGDHERSYKQLEGYCQLLLNSNPGSVACVQQTAEGHFLRMFLAFAPCLVGFQHCRPFIGLDSTLLKNKYLGVLLIAAGIDANDQLYPLAFGIANAENDENWVWFAAMLRQSLGEIPRKLTFVSSRHKGLIEGVANAFGEQVEHAYCMRHFAENFRKQFKDLQLVELLWTAARALTTEGYMEAMGKIHLLNSAAAQWIVGECDPKYWASVYFKGERYGHLTSNIVDSLSAWLLECREYPIISMLEKIRENLGTMFFERRMKAREALDEIAVANDDALIALVQSANEVVKESIERGRTYQVIQYDEVHFEVKTGHHSCVVHLGQFTCSCKQWQSSGIPCAHAAAAILFKRQQVQAYARKEFLLSAYHDSYRGTIVPFVANEATLGTMLLPLTRRPPGRPKKQRIKTEDKEKRALHCDRCKGVGHNKRTCDAPI